VVGCKKSLARLESVIVRNGVIERTIRAYMWKGLVPGVKCGTPNIASTYRPVGTLKDVILCKGCAVKWGLIW
jgi:hypothetical protein